MIEPLFFLDGRVALHCGDCLDVLAALPENSVDSVITDPPYHLTSIVKRFGAEGAAEAKEGTTGAYKRASAGFMGKQWDGGDIAFQSSTWAAVLRVLKPGGYILAFASTRGFGRMSVAIEDAGFITHPLIAWVFGSGFPKATRIKADGYDGFRYGGQALKPAIEPIFMGQKPFSEVNGTSNILLHGTGAINIDGCRVGDADTRNVKRGGGNDFPHENDSWTPTSVLVGSASGRWPANLIHDGSDEVMDAFPAGLTSGTPGIKRGGNDGAAYGAESRAPGTQMGGFGDTGSAARFFYTAKADADDRIGSKHPTVKPVDLMQYLCRLVTPPRVVEFVCDTCNNTPHDRKTNTSEESPLRDLPDSVQAEGQWARGEVLQPSVRVEEPAASRATLRAVRDDIPAEEGRSEALLFAGMRNEVVGASQAQTPYSDNSRISSALSSGASDGEQAGLLDGAPLHNGGALGAQSTADGGGASHQRSEGRQSNRQSSSDDEGSARPDEKTASAHNNHMSALRGENKTERRCPACNSPLRRVERPGVVLDPFAGTGTTGEAAWREGFKAVLIEREPEYQADIARRMDLAVKPTKRAAVAKSKNNLMGAEGTPLFGGEAA
jgi:site-specific DNA-methyltransferase (adenine-specific)